MKHFHAVHSQTDRFTGTCLRVQCPHRLGVWPRRESCSRDTPSLQPFTRKGGAENSNIFLDCSGVLYHLLQISVRICIHYQSFFTSFFSHYRLLLWPPPWHRCDCLSTTHQNLWPRHSKAADFHLQSCILSVELTVESSHCWWWGRGKDKADQLVMRIHEVIDKVSDWPGLPMFSMA